MFCDIVKAHSNLSVSGTDSMRKEVSRTLFFFLNVTVLTGVTHPFGQKKLLTQQELKKGSSLFVTELGCRFKAGVNKSKPMVVTV